MLINKNGMEIEFDMDCMDTDARLPMEDALMELLHSYGWARWASGADCVAPETGRPRSRDMAFRYCPDMTCEHWDGRSGCDAPKTRCVRENGGG